MKNIQVIDGAENCTYSLFATDDEAFGELFPNGQDIEFAESSSSDWARSAPTNC